MKKEEIKKIVSAIHALPNDRPVRLMEVCGTHTMSIARYGIKSMLPENVKLLSGPGCPVCVTPAEEIDRILALAMRENVIITTYGDMIRVPGTVPGDNLARRRAQGAKVEVVYSPIDAIDIAKNNPGSEIVFLGVGFETTAPGTAAAVLTAKEENIHNFSVFSMLKTVEPALRALISGEEFNVDGFLCPGHVATIIGEKGFSFLAEEYRIPAVVAGFEAEEILAAIYALLKQIYSGEARVENMYARAVAKDGNLLAQKMIDRCLVKRTDTWRGLGTISGGGLGLKDELAALDAEKKLAIPPAEAKAVTACRCGDVITGKVSPEQCPLFGKRCVPEDPVGPCMVSGEGACAAAYKYADVI